MEGLISKDLTSVLSLVTTLMLLLSVHLKGCNAARFLAEVPSSTQFIRASCSKTSYSELCFNSLSSYASIIQDNPMQLAHTAISVTLDAARSTFTDMKTMARSGGMSHRVAEAMSDCMDNVGDSVDDLKQSMEAMYHLGGKSVVGFQLNSIQTWVSTALTDDSTCMDGFSGNSLNGEVKAAVRSHVLNVAHLTSNALAFINYLASAPSSP